MISPFGVEHGVSKAIPPQWGRAGVGGIAAGNMVGRIKPRYPQMSKTGTPRSWPYEPKFMRGWKPGFEGSKRRQGHR